MGTRVPDCTITAASPSTSAPPACTLLYQPRTPAFPALFTRGFTSSPCLYCYYSHLARRTGDIVLVTANYRLYPLFTCTYLNSASPTSALQDQTAVLRLRSATTSPPFGGDPLSRHRLRSVRRRVLRSLPVSLPDHRASDHPGPLSRAPVLLPPRTPSFLSPSLLFLLPPPLPLFSSLSLFFPLLSFLFRSGFPRTSLLLPSSLPLLLPLFPFFPPPLSSPPFSPSFSPFFPFLPLLSPSSPSLPLLLSFSPFFSPSSPRSPTPPPRPRSAPHALLLLPSLLLLSPLLLLLSLSPSPPLPFPLSSPLPFFFPSSSPPPSSSLLPFFPLLSSLSFLSFPSSPSLFPY